MHLENFSLSIKVTSISALHTFDLSSPRIYSGSFCCYHRCVVANSCFKFTPYNSFVILVQMSICIGIMVLKKQLLWFVYLLHIAHTKPIDLYFAFSKRLFSYIYNAKTYRLNNLKKHRNYR